MQPSAMSWKAKDKVPVLLRGGPGDGRVLYLREPPFFITYGEAEGRYVRVPTDGQVVEYRFARYD
jgi:hypothetical protein